MFAVCSACRNGSLCVCVLSVADIVHDSTRGHNVGSVCNSRGEAVPRVAK